MANFRDSVINPDEVPYNSVYSESADQEFALGAILTLKDGRKFRYAKNGATALAAGKVVASTAPVANHTNIATGAVSAAGQKVVTISTTLSTALTADQYAGGWFLVNDATGEGQVYKVASNTAGTTGTVTLETDLVTALDATSEFTLIANRYNGVVVAPTTTAAPNAGVPLIAVTASYYFWCQVAGPAPVLTNGTVVIGDPVEAAQTTAGAAGPRATSSLNPSIGVVMSVNASTEYSLIDLALG